MLFTNTTYIGIDPSGSSKKMSYAALNQELRPIALGSGNLDDMLAFVGGQQNAFVAVNAPQGLNRGLLAKRNSKNPLSPAPLHIDDYRLAEYELWRRAIHIYHTPGSTNDCKSWMRTGFLLYQRLNDMAYQAYPAKSAQKQYIEVSPQACYCVWLEQIPLPQRSLEGRLQRQLILYDLGLEIPDPMRYFEEITRHRLLQGRLPTGVPYSWPELDALAGAFAAWTAANHPDQATLVGQPDEGNILVPVGTLKSHYRNLT
jgi:hypothetical protein